MRTLRFLPLWLLLLAGFALRMYDLTDPPLEFHPTRQLKGAITARYLYTRWNPKATPQDLEAARKQLRRIVVLEPPVLESLVALTYLALGREALWVARIYTSLFWVLGALGLYLLARREAPAWAALVAPAYMLFLPFAVVASRAFQPDPGMTAALVWSAYALRRWLDQPTRGNAWLAAGLSGLTVFLKGYAFFPIMGLVAAALWARFGGLRPALRHRATYLLPLPALLVLVGYYGLWRNLTGFYASAWSLSLARLWFTPTFYMRWAHNVIRHLNGPWLLFAFVGWSLAPGPRGRRLALGWLVGYGVYAFLVPYQAMTHNYYHLPLLPWVGWAAAWAAMPLWEALRARPRLWQAVALLAAVGGIVYASATVVRELAAKDYRAEPAFWQELVQRLPEGRYIGLLQDYGLRMTYFGGRNMDLWPDTGLLEVWQLKGRDVGPLDLFREKTEGYDYFLVTAMGQWERQPTLRRILTENYPLVLEGDGYLVFDLRRPKPRSQGQ